MIAHVQFEGERTLIGPKTWKSVVPLAIRNAQREAFEAKIFPDEIFSFIRGCGFFRGAAKEPSEAKLEAFRHAPEVVQKGWQPFHGSLEAGLRRAAHEVAPARSEFCDFQEVVPQHKQYHVRRVHYRLNEGHHGVEVRADVNLTSAFGMMAKLIRFLALSLEAEWRLVDGPPPELARRRQQGPFRLLSNAADACCRQPPHFEHQLRPEQLRSLRWMIGREEESLPLVLDYRCFWRRTGDNEAVTKSAALEWCLDCRLTATFNLKGGILADEIGYGKTALAIGLVDMRHPCQPPPLPKTEDGFFFSSGATLVCVPSHLHQQWVDEFDKFTGNRYRILRLRTGADMRKATVQDLVEADVVICNYQLLRGPLYEKRRQEFAQLARPDDKDKDDALAAYRSLFGGREHAVEDLSFEDLRLGTFKFLKDPERSAWRKSLQTGPAGGVPAWKRLCFPVLEQFFWRRVIFDEFHELEALQPAQRASLQFLRAHYRWGLTGTPLLRAARHIVAMASLFRIDVAGPIADPEAGENKKWTGDSDPVVIENCGRFLDACVRQNTSKELPNVRLVEHLILVKHTPPERALYLAARQEVVQPMSADGSGETARQRNRRLLILCSHFSEGALRSVSHTAGDECRRVLDMRRGEVDKVREPLKDGLLGLEGFRMLKIVGDADLQNRLQEIATSTEERCREAGGLIAQAHQIAKQSGLPDLLKTLRGDDGWKKVLRRAAAEAAETANAEQQAQVGAQPPSKAGGESSKKPRPLREDELERSLQSCERSVRPLLDDMVAATGRLLFLQKTLELVADGSDASTRSCSICFDDGLALGQLGITPCAHVFCISCLQAQVASPGKCGICRQPLRPGDARPLMLEMEKQEDAPQPDPVDNMSDKLRRYGTKLGRIVMQLRQIKAEDATAKCIVFCQWECLLKRIAGAFTDLGIQHALLQGGVNARTRTIQDFKDARSKKDVLLLSLEQNASGTNLTVASHVLLVHPMNADTEEQAVAFELQAIGRIRRWGQLRPEVHLWRFCALGTAEEELTRLHRREILDRAEKQGSEATMVDAAPGQEEAASPPRSSNAAAGSAAGAPASGSSGGKAKGRGRGGLAGRGRRRNLPPSMRPVPKEACGNTGATDSRGEDNPGSASQDKRQKFQRLGAAKLAKPIDLSDGSGSSSSTSSSSSSSSSE